MQTFNRQACVLLGGKMEPRGDSPEAYARSTRKLPYLCVQSSMDAGTPGVAESSGHVPGWEQQELFPNEPSEETA
jgi:hypothetical protein